MALVPLLVTGGWVSLPELPFHAGRAVAGALLFVPVAMLGSWLIPLAQRPRRGEEPEAPPQYSEVQ